MSREYQRSIEYCLRVYVQGDTAKYEKSYYILNVERSMDDGGGDKTDIWCSCCAV